MTNRALSANLNLIRSGCAGEPIASATAITLADRLDEAVRLLTEWTEAYDRGRLFDETSDFLRRVRP
jgi:hypothetical protein